MSAETSDRVNACLAKAAECERRGVLVSDETQRKTVLGTCSTVAGYGGAGRGAGSQAFSGGPSRAIADHLPTAIRSEIGLPTRARYQRL